MTLVEDGQFYEPVEILQLLSQVSAGLFSQFF